MAPLSRAPTVSWHQPTPQTDATTSSSLDGARNSREAITLPWNPANNARAVASGDDVSVTIPVGSVGMTIDFAGDARTLVYANGNVMIGDQIVTANLTLLG